jgi:hypothetical protein
MDFSHLFPSPVGLDRELCFGSWPSPIVGQNRGPPVLPTHSAALKRQSTLADLQRGLFQLAGTSLGRQPVVGLDRGARA